VLDLCCGGGGFSAGLHAAGFDVIGVDIEAQPHYPFDFVKADALDVDLRGFAAIVASPPCQRWSVATPPNRRQSHPDVLTPLRERLIASGVPWVMENVPGAPMRRPIQLCGTTLRLGVRRHRLFESSVPLAGTPCLHDSDAPPIGVYGTHGGQDGSVDVSTARAAMGISWLPWDSLAQSIPPVYGLWIGMQLWAHIGQGPWEVPSLHDRRPGRIGHRGSGDGCAQVDDLGDAIPPAAFGHQDQNDGSAQVVDHGVRDGCDQVDDHEVTEAHSRVTSSARQSSVDRPPCRHCGAHPASRPATGRWGVYCSHACRQAAYRVRQSQSVMTEN
jgi:hypothetical protein